MRYTLPQNIKFVYKESFKKSPIIKKLLVINFITELLLPLSATAITTLVVYALTNNVEINQYILLIVALTLATFIIEALRYWSFIRYTFENTFTRNTRFWIRLAMHQINTDYANVEAKSNRKRIRAAYEAVGSNWNGIELMMKQAPILIINTVGMLFYGTLVALKAPIIVVILLTMTIVNFYLTKRANKYLENVKPYLIDEINEKFYLSQDATNPNYGKDIRIYKLGRWFSELFVKLTQTRKTLTGRFESKFLFARVSNTIFLLIRDIFAFVILLNLVLNNSIDLATFIFLTGIVTGFTLWLNAFIEASNHLRSANISVNQYRDCMNMEEHFNRLDGYDINNLELPIEIEFKNVTYTYPETEEATIKNLSFTIKAGEKVALVGNNGAGKTTIVKLLTGLYKADSGQILLNGIDIMEFNINDYMDLFSVVFQDTEPMAISIESNVACAKEEHIDKERLYDALDKSGLLDKVKSLPHKEKTYITQIINKEGIRLSGGENQKLILARSLYKKAPLLILDEPTAKLDPIAEEEMYLKYESFVEGNSTIFISHRLSSTKFCDRILFLEDGKIIEEGTHYELISKDTKYKEIFDIQSKYYKEGEDNE